jgi:hypothetical protein
MENQKCLVLLLIGALFSNAYKINGQELFKKDSLTEETVYFNEEKPGLTPKRFEPQILSQDGRFEGGTYSPDMKEFYFIRKNGKYKKRTIFVIRNENNVWGKESQTDIKWPHFSADGNTMYLGKMYRVRTDTGWSKPRSQGEFLKDMAHGLSVSAKGFHYFAVYKKEDKGIHGAIYSFNPLDHSDEEPTKLSAAINTGKYIAHPYIAPDESYLIWDVVREDGFGQADIYISFRQKNGAWLPAMNMGDKINTPGQESGASVTPDGKFLFFSRTKENVTKDGIKFQEVKQFWVDAQIIEHLRPKQ